MTRNKINVLISNNQKFLKIDKRKLKKFISDICLTLLDVDLPETVQELSVVFTDDKEIALLNGQYRNKYKATDVLSFSQVEGEGDAYSLGDIVISVERALIQARKYKVTAERELQRLLIHGILHLYGFDHEGVSNAERQRMKRREKKLTLMFKKDKNK